MAAPVITYLLNQVAIDVASACTLTVGTTCIVVPVIEWIKSSNDLTVQIAEGPHQTIEDSGGHLDEDVIIYVGIFRRSRLDDAQKHHYALISTSYSPYATAELIVKRLQLSFLPSTLGNVASRNLAIRPMHKLGETQIVKNEGYPGLLGKQLTFKCGFLTTHPIT